MEYSRPNSVLEDVPLADIAKRQSTPCYVYSSKAILEKLHAYQQAFGDVPHQVCYAVKANSNLAILRLLAEAGAGFDIVSGGELFRVLQAGADPREGHLLGRGKNGRRAGLCSGAANKRLQLRVRAGAGLDRFAGGAPRSESSGRRCG